MMRSIFLGRNTRAEGPSVVCLRSGRVGAQSHLYLDVTASAVLSRADLGETFSLFGRMLYRLDQVNSRMTSTGMPETATICQSCIYLTSEPLDPWHASIYFFWNPQLVTAWRHIIIYTSYKYVR